MQNCQEKKNRNKKNVIPSLNSPLLPSKLDDRQESMPLIQGNGYNKENCVIRGQKNNISVCSRQPVRLGT